METTIALAGRRHRPFSEITRLKCRAYSIHLQRVIVDFGADVSFQETQKKITEHYRIQIPLSSIQSVVKNHARNILEFVENETIEEGNADQIIAEMDGSMIPVVDMGLSEDEKVFDSRRCRNTRWQEARLCFARKTTNYDSVFYATLGGVEKAGDLLYRAAKKVGLNQKTKVHGLGDGARWIEDQMRRVFGKQVKYLVDFYHLSEYLAKAAEHSWTSEKQTWLKEKQEWMKAGHYKKVLSVIRRRLPMDWDPLQKKENQEGTPVEKCYKYINNRKEHFDYARAINEGLPIGSGEIESAHKHVIQKRLKISGAWWRPETAEDMLALRAMRANNDWAKYWDKLKAA